MKENVYVRSNKSIFTISITRIIFLLPLIIYGFYKNGIYLYQNNYINMIQIFKPLAFILSGALIGALVNYLYDLIKRNKKKKIIDSLFSTFYIEYGIVLGCLMSINTNILIFILVTFILLMLSRFIKQRINYIALIFIIIYAISYFTGGFSYANIYETGKFSLDLADYIIGRGIGGIATTHILFVIIAIFGLFITSNSKTTITVSGLITLLILFVVYGIVSNESMYLIFSNSYIFILTFVATDSISSCYTKNGMTIYGILIGLLTFGLYFVNPIIAPFIAIAIVSLFNNLIDRKTNILKNK